MDPARPYLSCRGEESFQHTISLAEDSPGRKSKLHLGKLSPETMDSTIWRLTGAKSHAVIVDPRCRPNDYCVRFRTRQAPDGTSHRFRAEFSKMQLTFRPANLQLKNCVLKALLAATTRIRASGIHTRSISVPKSKDANTKPFTIPDDPQGD